MLYGQRYPIKRLLYIKPKKETGDQCSFLSLSSVALDKNINLSLFFSCPDFKHCNEQYRVH